MEIEEGVGMVVVGEAACERFWGENWDSLVCFCEKTWVGLLVMRFMGRKLGGVVLVQSMS